jgi:hypothetical protein
MHLLASGRFQQCDFSQALHDVSVSASLPRWDDFADAVLE